MMQHFTAAGALPAARQIGILLMNQYVCLECLEQSSYSSQITGVENAVPLHSDIPHASAKRGVCLNRAPMSSNSSSVSSQHLYFCFLSVRILLI
jgi:hypothetical protein